MSSSKLFSAIKDHSAVQALVGTRVYGRFLPHGMDTFPAVSFLFVSDSPVMDLQGEASIVNQRWQIDCWSTRIAEVEQLADAVKTAISETTEFRAIRLGSSSSFEEQSSLFRITLEFSIWY